MRQVSKRNAISTLMQHENIGINTKGSRCHAPGAFGQFAYNTTAYAKTASRPKRQAHTLMPKPHTYYYGDDPTIPRLSKIAAVKSRIFIHIPISTIYLSNTFVNIYHDRNAFKAICREQIYAKKRWKQNVIAIHFTIHRNKIQHQQDKDTH